MKVEKVSANIRYSQDTGRGAWKVVELGAEASIGEREHWRQAQSELYYQLGDQLRTLWSRTTGADTNGTQPNRQHWCEDHQQEFKRRAKAGTVWYSHRQGSAWCNEPEPVEKKS